MSVKLLAFATPEQEMLVDTTARFIEKTLPLAKVRELAESAGNPDTDYVQTASSLGWFGLLVDEAHGGGSASGNGLLDAAAVGAERGAVLQPGPFVGLNVVAHALSADGPRHGALLERLVAGQTRATWVAGTVGGLTPGPGEIVARSDGDGYVVDGEVRLVHDVAGCETLLVSALGPGGPVQVLIGADAAGVEVRALSGLDVTRRVCAVRLRGVQARADAVVGVPGAPTEARLRQQLAVAAVLCAAESAGAMHTEFETALEYAKARIAFGRPIGSFQAIKHLLADTSLSLEMAKGLVAAAAEALGEGRPDGIELAHAAKAFVAERGVELAHACFQVFGGIGYTWEHDHHLFMRRLAADAVAFGSADWHRGRLAEQIGAD
ncbi:acyl-CoA/acyl-ACP dehydrogenase [Frankia sp. CNm7]|uniref:Acyl-CoA/acyl-ACP dehydrogenase n=1 Tax=Frankia nepalensis TaxID=1836974 RepID=A0A937RML4_9ACTN|nr:acyl-CoA dehydrogenase family protein [Frankia nepalensis]MBL7498693.1 acyl-CoA/acyl-ACP dehydrogenase [Frankia nepalensis]MBL7512915.1 acyl-CoA/acyl-ACP dehydrogenase [Frankia nepalensis]MBL7521649.1 acyl-CoA/acyl-ACP dehydrogenase [Frankia nepalensis]MBL7633222.1 acyl-CoA/acyl-ACP dehydrogenase [Frankia nepalensis]